MSTVFLPSSHLKEESTSAMEEKEAHHGGGGPQDIYAEEVEEEDDENLAERKDAEKARILAGPHNLLTSSSPALGAVNDARHSPQRGSKRCRGSTAKERISKMLPCAAGKRSSIYRGVTRHRWTGRYEAHLWDKSSWNQNLNKKGKQVYLGAYDDEEAAARAYDLAALKYWGPGTLINFPVSDYARDIDEMKSVSREDYLASLRRKSSGFSRGFPNSKMRGGRQHHAAMRWDAQGGRSFVTGLPQFTGNGTFGDASTTMIDLFHFMNWLQPSALISEATSRESPKSGSTAMESDRWSEDQQREDASGGKEEKHRTANQWRCDRWSEDQQREDASGGKEEKHRTANQWRCEEQNIGRQSSLGVSAMAALSMSPMFAKLEKRVEAAGDDGSEMMASRRKRRSESAAAALAAAMAMAMEPPQQRQEQSQQPFDPTTTTTSTIIIAKQDAVAVAAAASSCSSSSSSGQIVPCVSSHPPPVASQPSIASIREKPIYS